MGTAVSVIRPMVADDLRMVSEMEQTLQPRPWSETTLREELAADNRVYLAAESGDRIVGFGGVMVIGDEAHITNLLVDEQHRGEGIGTRLVVSLIESAVDKGARHLTLEVRARNERARRLYARLGMAPAGVRPRYYGDDDAVIMWAHDIDRPGYLESLQ